MYRPAGSFLTLAVAVVLGCVEGPDGPASSTSDGSASTGKLADEASWVRSNDRQLELRISLPSDGDPPETPLTLVCELRNASSRPVTVLRPCGDWYEALAIHCKIWSEQELVKYAGPTPSYVIGANAFVTLEPGQVVEDRLELIAENFPGIEGPGTLALRYDYSYDGKWDAIAARDGVRDAWRGTIASREIRVERP